MSDLTKVWVIEISYGNYEKETLHLISETKPLSKDIDNLVIPYIKKVWHESGKYEVEDIYTVQESVERLLSFVD
ncbi:hypothetical protein KW496_19565 [Vibrio fluvialis]|nr:hypothetical protein [Vibrio fluvialis]